jgi:hypothetical protein
VGWSERWLTQDYRWRVPTIAESMMQEHRAVGCLGVAGIGIGGRFAQLKTITGLNLEFTHATDVGLKEISQLEGLRTLYLWGAKVTDAGVTELQKALPKCKIERESSR